MAGLWRKPPPVSVAGQAQQQRASVCGGAFCWQNTPNTSRAGCCWVHVVGEKRDTNLMFCRSSRLRWLMVMPLVSASWTALPEATWACLKGICSTKGTEQRGLSSVPPLHPKNSHLQVSLWHLLPSEPGTEPGQWPTSPGSAPSPCSPC